MNAQVIDGEIVDQPRNTAMQASAPASSPMGSALAFMQAGGNIEQLNHMMDLQDRWEANEARKAFTVAMTGFKAEPVEIFKRKQVAFLDVKYMHAELSDVTDAIGPALAKHQLSYRWNVRQEGGAIHVDCILTHVLGHFEMVTMSGAADNTGKKNPIQQTASTAQYLQRYTLLAITGMSTKGMDDDGRGSEPPPEANTITEAQEIQLSEMLESTGSDKAKFLAWLKVAKLSDIPAKSFASALATIKQKERAK